MSSSEKFAICGLFAAIALAGILFPGVNAQDFINEQQIIIRLKPEVIESKQQFMELRETLLDEWRAEFGINLDFVRNFRTDGFILAAKEPVKQEQMEAIIQGMDEDSRVRYAEPNAVMTISPPRGGSSVKPRSETQ